MILYCSLKVYVQLDIYVGGKRIILTFPVFFLITHIYPNFHELNPLINSVGNTTTWLRSSNNWSATAFILKVSNNKRYLYTSTRQLIVWFSLLSFPLQSLSFQVTQLMPGKHKHQSKYTEFYPHTHGLPFSVNSSQFADYATPTMPWAAAVVQWIERAPPKR